MVDKITGKFEDNATVVVPDQETLGTISQVKTVPEAIKSEGKYSLLDNFGDFYGMKLDLE